ncbi:MAG: hypothetical protein JXR13_13545 [Thalassovita sp.]
MSQLKRLQLAILGLLILYFILLEPVGFHISTAVIETAMIHALGAQPIYFPFLAVIGLTFAISFLFEGLMKVVLPLGYFKFAPPYGLLGL